MKVVLTVIMSVLFASTVCAQWTAGRGSSCGPNPMPQMGAAQQNYSQQQAQQKQIAVMDAQFQYQQSVARLQNDFRKQQIQNQGNTAVMQSAAQNFQQQMQQAQQSYAQQLQNLQR